MLPPFQNKAASLLQRVLRRRLVRKNLLRAKKSAATMGRISKTCCQRLGIPFFGGQRRMFTTLTSKIKSGMTLRQRYRAVGRQLLVSSAVSAEAALDYEMALVACSDEHRRACNGRNAVQLAIENLRLEACGGSAEAAAAKYNLHRIFAGCCPQTSSGWDVVHYGLRHGAVGAAAIVMYDIAEVRCSVAAVAACFIAHATLQAMQMANVYDDARHNPDKASRMLLDRPIEVVHNFCGALGIASAEHIIDLLGCDDIGYGGLEMMQPGERIPDAILLFLKAATKKAYAMRAMAHRERVALLNSVWEGQTKRSAACI
jgi:hypothetical protein